MKQKYIIVDDESSESFPIDWTKLPEDIIDDIPGKCLYNVLSCKSDGSIIERTVIFLRPVRKFSRGTKKYDLGDIVIGYDIL